MDYMSTDFSVDSLSRFLYFPFSARTDTHHGRSCPRLDFRRLVDSNSSGGSVGFTNVWSLVRY